MCHNLVCAIFFQAAATFIDLMQINTMLLLLLLLLLLISVSSCCFIFNVSQ